MLIAQNHSYFPAPGQDRIWIKGLRFRQERSNDQAQFTMIKLNYQLSMIKFNVQFLGLVGMDKFNRNGALAHSPQIEKRSQRRGRIEFGSTDYYSGKKGNQ